MWPVPEGKGIRLASREKYLTAKWRGVEKCSEDNVHLSQESLEVMYQISDGIEVQSITNLERNLSELK